MEMRKCFVQEQILQISLQKTVFMNVPWNLLAQSASLQIAFFAADVRTIEYQELKTHS
jgi:hypothetical protein